MISIAFVLGLFLAVGRFGQAEGIRAVLDFALDEEVEYHYFNDLESAGSFSDFSFFVDRSVGDEFAFDGVPDRSNDQMLVPEEPVDLGVGSGSQQPEPSKEYFKKDQVTHHPYDERLDVEAIGNKFFLYRFSFEVNSTEFNENHLSESSTNSYTHNSFFPNHMANLLEQTNSSGLTLQLSSGRLSDVFSSEHSRLGAGAEVSAIVNGASEAKCAKQWEKMMNMLQNTFGLPFKPAHGLQLGAVQKSGSKVVGSGELSSHQQFHHKIDLTNSLQLNDYSKFLHLLPTKGRTGISQLLYNKTMAHCPWHQLVLNVATECNEKSHKCIHRMEKYIEILLDRADTNLTASLTNEFLQNTLHFPHRL